MKGKKMFKCRMEKGVMTFVSDTKTYTPTGRTLNTIDAVIEEYDLVGEITGDHAWAFPVVEQLNRRKQLLLENLILLCKREKDGRNILKSEKAEAPTDRAGADNDGRGAGAEDKKKKAPRQV